MAEREITIRLSDVGNCDFCESNNVWNTERVYRIRMGIVDLYLCSAHLHQLQAVINIALWNEGFHSVNLGG